MGQIVLFDSVKGGVGKSTLLAQFAVALSGRVNVAVMDCDPQGSIEKWAVRRHSGGKYEMNFAFLETDLAFLSESKSNYDFILVDSAGADTATGRELLLLADIVISPLQPTQAALDTVPNHSHIISEALMLNSDMKVVYLLNNCDTHAKDNEATDARDTLVEFLSESQVASVVEQFIYNRKLLKTSYSDGGSCFDSRKNKSRDEILNVISSIFGEV